MQALSIDIETKILDERMRGITQMGVERPELNQSKKRCSRKLFSSDVSFAYQYSIHICTCFSYAVLRITKGA
jgi:hypothetical protein